MKRTRHYLLLLLSWGISYSNCSAQAFTELGVTLTGSTYSNAAWGDYDSDNDLDIIVVGSGYSRIYRNDGGGVFTYVSTGIAGIQTGDCAWGDYDNDGDLDLAITGSSGGKISKIYRNDGSNVFTDINAGLIGVDWSALAWGDYDNDGKIDLLVSGLNSSDEPTARLYHNDGSSVFSDSKIAITPFARGKIKWGDYNNDNLPDILMIGQDFNGNANTEIYRNEGGTKFVSINANFSDGFRGGVDWGDYDNDGDLDVAVGGQMSGAHIYKNNGNGTFTDINAGLPGLSYCPVAWGDYDNDGDLDLIIAGVNVYNGTAYTQLYQNKGNNTFTEDANTIMDCYEGSLTWGDYDNDGDVDLLITGYDNSSSNAKIYRNNTPNTNSAPTTPSGIQTTVINNGAVLQWSSSTDTKTPSAGLTYNVRIGTTSGGINTLSPMANTTTGFMKNPALGNAMQGNNYTVKGLPVGTYYWSVQAVDPNFKASLFSSTGSFDILTTTTDMNVNMLSVKNSALAWGDYDSDGDMDLLLTGYDVPNSKAVSKIYRNNGSAVFDTISANLKGIHYGTCAWGDYDNDGDLDILLAGNTGESPNYNPISKIYRNNWNSTFTDINAALTGVGFGSSAWGDYDNDGDLDILLTSTSTSTVYRNDGNGTFVDIHANLAQSNQGTASWGDFDKDNDLDVLICGTGGTKIYRNNGSNTFTALGATLPGATEGSANWGDYDNDGYLDILFTGSSNNYNSATVYRNDGSGGFTAIDAGLRGVSESVGVWGDFNNDGYSDILYTGRSGSFISKIYINNKNGTFSDIYAPLSADYRSKLATVDYDNDGDLDMIITMYGTKPILYRNNMNFPNDPPNAPSNLHVENSGLGVILSWDPSADAQSTTGGLYYNIRLGKTAQGYDIISPMVTTGNKRKIPSIGNAQMNTSWRIDSLAVGTYYWSVQAIDQSYLGGAWAAEQKFTVSKLRPYFSSDTACYGDSTKFLDQTITTGTEIASWSWAFGDGQSSSLQNPKHLFASAGTYSATLEVTDTAGVKMSKTNPVLVLPRPTTNFSISNVCIGSMASVVNIPNADTLAITSWTWDYGDGTIVSQQYPGPHGYLNTGTYDISLTILAKNGCSNIKTKPIAVAEYPTTVISAAGSTEFCEGDSVKLSVPYNKNYTYEWKIGNTPITQADSSVFEAKYSGNFKANVTNLTAGCISESIAAVPVAVANTPDTPLIIASGNTTFCEGDSITLSVPYTEGYTYKWTLNGGNVGTNSNSYVAKFSGAYSLTLSNSAGCSANSTNTINVTVNPRPELPLLSFGETTVCNGETVAFSVPLNANNTYQWRKGTENIGNATSNSFAAHETGDYSLIVTNSNNQCWRQTPPVTVTVNEKPSKPIIAEATNTTLFCFGADIELQVTNANPSFSYKWKRWGDVIAEATDATLKGKLIGGDYLAEATLGNCATESDILTLTTKLAPAKPSIYAKGPNVWLLACDNTTAKDYRWYYNEQMILGAKSNQYIANQNLGNYFVEVGEGGECYTSSDVINIPSGNIVNGIDDLVSDAIALYPNPTENVFWVALGGMLHGKLQVSIEGVSGKTIAKYQFLNSSAFSIDLSKYPDGIYFCKMSYLNSVVVKKIVKQ